MTARPINKKLRNDRRREILLVSAEVFRAKGFHGASMEELCAAAGMSPGTLYNYFPGKDAIIKALVEAELEHYSAVVERLMGSPDALQRLLAGETEALKQALEPHEYYVGPECWLEIMRNDSLGLLALGTDTKLRATVAKAIRKTQKQGLLDASLAPRSTANVLVALLAGIAFDAETIPGYDLAGTVKSTVVLLQRYLSPASARPSRPKRS